jgi:hypothetical protein
MIKTKNGISGHNWDINELKTQISELKETYPDTLAKLNSLYDDYHSRTFDIDIEALYKKMQFVEK